MNTAEMETTAIELVALGKGILAVDESGPTMEKRFKQVGCWHRDRDNGLW